MSLKAIHMLRRELQLSDGEYRQLLMDVAGVNSAKLLSDDGDRAVMRRLYRLREERKGGAPKATPNAKSDVERKVWQLWYDLKGLLPQEKQTPAYLVGFIENAIGTCDLVRLRGQHVDMTALNGKYGRKVIEALKLRIQYEQAQLAHEVPF